MNIAQHCTPLHTICHVQSPPLTAVVALSLAISARSFGTPAIFTLPDSWLEDTLSTYLHKGTDNEQMRCGMTCRRVSRRLRRHFATGMLFLHFGRAEYATQPLRPYLQLGYVQLRDLRDLVACERQPFERRARRQATEGLQAVLRQVQPQQLLEGLQGADLADVSAACIDLRDECRRLSVRVQLGNQVRAEHRAPGAGPISEIFQASCKLLVAQITRSGFVDPA